MKYTLLLLLLNIWFNGHYMDYLGHFYQTVETEHGFAKGIIILESTQPSIISCVYICQGINANSIYQDGSCKCFRENDDMNERLISSSKYWQKLPHICSVKNSQTSLKAFDQMCYCNDSLTSSERVSCYDTWTLIASDVCYSGKGNAYGAFRFKKPGLITSLKLEHVSGMTTCKVVKNKPFGSSIWTCGYSKERLTTFVTGIDNTIIFPFDVILKQAIYKMAYRNKSMFKTFENTLTYYGPNINVSLETELRIWNANDLAGDDYDQNNKGRHCVDVYGQYNQE